MARNIVDKTSIMECSFEKEFLFDTINAAGRLTNAVMFVYDFLSNTIVFHTENCRSFAELTQQVSLFNTPNRLWSLISKDDLTFMRETTAAYSSLIQGLVSNNRLKHVFIMSYRITANKKEYVVAQKFTPLRLNKEGKLWLGLFSITPSNQKPCERTVVFGKGFRYLYDVKTKKFQAFKEQIKLTETEKKILLRSSKGMTVEQIASDLNKSHNTIKTQKRGHP